MFDSRKLTIRVSIDLGPRGTLQLEASDSFDSYEYGDSLRHDLAEHLEGYGRNSPEVRRAIRRYINDVLADEPLEGIETEEIPETPVICEEPATEVPEAEEPEPAQVSLPESEPEPELEESDIQGLKPAPVVDSVEEEYECSRCGATITRLQRDVSLLFNRRVLCKDCMK